MYRPNQLQVATEFFGRLSIARQRLLLLDQGAVVGSRVPSGAHAPTIVEINDILERVLRETDTHVVIISSGSARELQTRLELNPAPEIWGNNGRERILPDGQYSNEPLDPSQSRALIIARNVLIRQNLESQLEQMPGGIALRWRGLTAAAANHARRLALSAWKPIAEGNSLDLTERGGGLELTAAYGVRSEAVRRLLRDLQAGGLVAYVGVDERDEEIFRSLLPPHLPVLMRRESRPSAARLCITEPEELFGFLHDWLAACGLAKEEIDH